VLVGREMTVEIFEAAATKALAGARPYPQNAFKVELAMQSIIHALSIAGGLA
jgi:xanthine dehydrogenase YagS FAD-binding subunit